MNKNTLELIDKTVFILLVVLAAAAILVAMVTGPLGYDSVSITASACACIIAVALLWHILHAARSLRRK